MQYDPIKNFINNFIKKKRFIRKLFYIFLDIFILRQWYVKKAINRYIKKDCNFLFYDAGAGFGQYSDYVLNKYIKSYVFALDLNDDYLADYYNSLRVSKKSRFAYTKGDLTNFTLKESVGAISDCLFAGRGLLGYRVSRGSTLLTPSPINALTFTDSNLPFGTHTYSVTAYFSEGESSPATVQANVVPVFNPPQNLIATAGDEIVNLVWQIPAGGSTGTVEGYRVYRNNTAITEIITGLTYIDIDVVNNTTYTYHVRAIYTDIKGVSAPSNSVSATPRPPVFNPPRSLQALAGNAVVHLSWGQPLGGSTGTLLGKECRSRWSPYH